MALVSSGNQILLKGTSDTNPTGQSFYLDTTITSGSTSCDVVAYTKTVEGPDVFYGLETTLDGTVYGFKTAQTSSYSGSTRLARGFDDTNPSLSGSQVLGSGFFDNIDWFGTNPETIQTGVTWWTGRGVVGIILGVDSGSLGSIGTQSYTGGGSAGTLEVHHFGLFNNNSSNYPNGTSGSTIGDQVLDTQAEGNWIMLTLKSTSASPPPSDDSFYSVIINGQEFLRSNAASVSQASSAAYDSNVSSGTHYYRTWRWDASDVTDSDLSAIGTTGSKSFKLSQGASSTLNTGISEEMSGGTDTDPIEFSDYYKDGEFHATTGIPTSGEIKFSDFYGKTRTPLVTALHTTSFVPDYNTFAIYSTNVANAGIRTSAFATDITAIFADDDFNPSNTFLGFTTNDVTIKDFYTNYSNTSSVPSVYVDFRVTFDIVTNESTATLDNTDGFTKIEVYEGTNTSGTNNFFSVNLADADSITVSDYGSYIRAFCVWSASDVSGTTTSFANHFGTSTTPSTNGTHTIVIT